MLLAIGNPRFHPLTAMIVSLDIFLDVLRRSQLLSPAVIDAAHAEYLVAVPASRHARGFAEALCQKRLLTVWQAQKLLAGKHRGFFLGQYALQRLVGKGGMSSVYLAEHRVLRRRCAIKVLPLAQAGNPTLLARFQREARAAAALDHPNIVRAFDGGCLNDGASTIHFLVMEYIDGRTLFDVVKNEGPLTVAQAMDVIRQAAKGLQHAHDAGLIHRDLKPENLIIDRSGTVRIMDLGLAKLTGNDDEQLTIQQEGRVLGTANYCAPEQAIDSHRVDSRVDLYSLGCTLYFLLSGRPPFNTGSLAQRLLAHQSQEPSRIESLRSDVPPELGALLRRMMAKTPAARIRTAGEVVDQLDRIAARLAAPKPAASIVPPQTGLTELRDAIAKVASVERAVAMLACDIGSAPGGASPRPRKTWKAAEIGAHRRRQRQQHGRRLAGGLVASFVAMVLSMATARSTHATASPDASFVAGMNHRPSSAAIASPSSVSKTVLQPIREPRTAIASPRRPERERAMVADRAQAMRSG